MNLTNTTSHYKLLCRTALRMDSRSNRVSFIDSTSNGLEAGLIFTRTFAAGIRTSAEDNVRKHLE